MACRGCEDQCHCTVVAGDGSVSVTGSGTAISPYTVSARASASSGNAVSVRPDGLYVPTSAVSGAWSVFTPTWSLAGGSIVSNPSLGNGTLSGRYARIGNTVFYNISLTMGSSTTVGAGTGSYWTFSAPVASQASLMAVGSASAIDTETTNFTGAVRFATATTLVVSYSGGTNYWGPLTPATASWDPGDSLRLSIMYEAA